MNQPTGQPLHRLLPTGALAVSLLAFGALLQRNAPLPCVVEIALYCFAVAIPLSALDLTLSLAELPTRELPALPAAARLAVGMVGPVAAWAGIALLFDYFSDGATYVFLAGSVLALGFAIYVARRR